MSGCLRSGRQRPDSGPGSALALARPNQRALISFVITRLLSRLGLLDYFTTETPWPLGPRSDEKFGDLHGIEGGAFEELVADDPESEAVFQSAILAEATDGAIVLAGEVERHRVALEFRLIDDL